MALTKSTALEPAAYEPTASDAAAINGLSETAPRLDSSPHPPRTQKYRGYIDSLSGGFLDGWATDDLRPELSLELIARIGHRVIGRCLANRHRPDLLAAGIGTGHYGFRMALDDLLGHGGATLELTADDGELIAVRKLPDDIERAGVNVEAVIVDGYAAQLTISSRETLGPRAVRVFVDDAFGGEARTTIEHGVRRLAVDLPARFFDDREHLLSIAIEGSSNRIGATIGMLRAVVTPWQYLQQRVTETSLSTLVPHARARYESLSRQLEGAPPGADATWIANLHRVHEVVLEGWQNRREFPPFSLPAHDAPKVSIIVPAHNKIELTYHCVAAIALAHSETTYEVIVVDDLSTDQTREIEAIIQNIVVVRNDTNLGFLRSVNRAVEAARGDYVFLLNNDTEVRSRFLDEALAPFADPTVGMTGSKLINLDGTLQEAGGLVWGNGQPWNLGRDSSAVAPDWNYVREVDYVSGAALCISRSLWRKVGGFSAEFAPAYYEDTDLAFKVRAAGYRTLYVPTSEVVHFEGQSNGTDVKQGIKRYQVINEGTFRRKWLHAYRSNGTEGVDVRLAKDRGVDYRVLAIDYTTPNPRTDAGGYAAVREIELLRALGCKVTFVPENMAHLGATTRDLQRHGVEMLYAPDYRSVSDVLERRGHEFDLVYVTRYHIAARHLAEIRAKTHAKIIFNNADLHFLRELRGQLATGSRDFSAAVSVRDEELALIRAVDAALTYNDVEQAVILSHNLKSDNIFTCPWVLDEKPRGPSYDDRAGIAFLGGYRHPPNVDAALFLAKEVMPHLRRKHPGIVLYLYGSNLPSLIADLAEEDIVPVGYVDSLDDVFHRHRVFVAPLRSGAGIKGKILEAAAYGTPTVMTPIAAEATGLVDGVSALIREDATEFANAVGRAYTDEQLWQKLSDRSTEIARERFSRAQGLAAFSKILGYVGCWPRESRATVGW